MKFKPVKKGTGTHKLVPKTKPSTPTKRRGGKYA